MTSFAMIRAGRVLETRLGTTEWEYIVLSVVEKLMSRDWVAVGDGVSSGERP